MTEANGKSLKYAHRFEINGRKIGPVEASNMRSVLELLRAGARDTGNKEFEDEIAVVLGTFTMMGRTIWPEEFK